MLRYYVFFYLLCASVTLYIGYRDIVLYDGEPPAEIEDHGGSKDTGGGRRKRRDVDDVGDFRVLGFELFLQKVEELRRVTSLLRLQKLQQHNPETFRQKAKLSNKKKKQEEEEEEEEEEDEKMAKGQSSMNPDQSQSQSQSQPSKSAGRQNAGKPSDESGGYPGSSRRKRGSDRRGGNSRKKRQKRQILDKLKASVQNAQNSNEQEKGGLYLQNPGEFFDEEKQIVEDNQVKEGVAKSMFVDHYIRTIVIFVGLQLLLGFIIMFAIWAQGYIRYDMWNFKQGTLYEMYRDWFMDWDKSVNIGGNDDAQDRNEAYQEKSEKVAERLLNRDDWIEKMKKKREETSQLRQVAKAQAERNQAAREHLDNLEIMEEKLARQARTLEKQKKKREKKIRKKLEGPT